MKSLWKILCNTLIASGIVFSIPSVASNAADKKGKASLTATAETSSDQRIEALDDLDFIEMLNSVDVGKASELIQKFQTKEGKSRLLNGKYNPKGECTVEAYRNKEVLLITIPAHLLFGPNMTELKQSASEYLTPIRRYLKEPDMYRVMLVMHTDNTGSEAYRDKLTVERAEAVFNWFDDRGDDTRYLFDYAMSDDMPLKPNNSVENRADNRRLEIYLVPGKKMLEQAKRGRIVF